MKNLKRALAVVLSLMMVLGTVVLAGPFSDVTDTTAYAEAIELNAALGLFTGYEDGEFRPEGELTRAEFTAIVTRFLGANAGTTGANTSFADVASSHWASGYVNFATSQRIINGYGDGNFGPEDSVLYEQAIKMLVVAVGYNEDVIGSGGYPVAYLTVAQQTGMLSGVQGAAVGQAVTRGQIAQLVANALEVPIVTQTGFGQWKDYDINDGTGDTYRLVTLTEKLGVVKVRAMVESSNELDTRRGDTVQIRVTNDYRTKYSDPDYNREVFFARQDAGGAQRRIAIGDTDLRNLVGAQANVYIAYDETSDSDPVAVYARRYVGTGDELVLNTGDIDAVDIDGDLVTVKYTEDSRSVRTESFDVSTAINVYVNGYSVTATPAQLQSVLEGYYGTATFSLEDSNTANYDYDTVFISHYANFVVDEVNTTLGHVTAKEYGARGIPFVNNVTSTLIFNENNTDNVVRLVDTDGSSLEWSVLEENDVLSVQVSPGSGTRTAYVATLVRDVVTGSINESSGTLSDPDDAEVGIGGTRYQVDGAALVDARGLNLGDEGSFYLDILGRIAYYDATRGITGNYAYVLKALQPERGWDDSIEIALFTYEGTVEIFATTSNINVRHGNASPVRMAASKLMAAGDDGYAGTDYSFFKADGDLKDALKDRVITYSLDASGKITRINLAPEGLARDASYFAAGRVGNAWTFDGSRERFSFDSANVNIDDSTIILKVAPTLAADDYIYSDSNYELLSLAALADVEEDSTVSTNIAAFDIDRNNVAGLVVVEDTTGEYLTTGAGNIGLVAGVGTTTNAYQSPVDKLDVYRGSTTMQDVLESEDGATIRFKGAGTDVTAGDAVAIRINGRNEYTRVDVIARYNATNNNVDFNSALDGGKVDYEFGRVIAKRGNSLTLDTGLEERIPSKANVFVYNAIGRSGTASAPALRQDVFSVSTDRDGVITYYNEFGTKIGSYGNAIAANDKGGVYALVVTDSYNDIIDVVFYILKDETVQPFEADPVDPGEGEGEDEGEEGGE